MPKTLKKCYYFPDVFSDGPWQAMAALGLLLAALAMPAAGLAGESCRTDSAGEYLRADGSGSRPWSFKVEGRDVVYVETCFIEELLAFFPEAVRARRYGAAAKARRPAWWQSADKRKMLTLSPESRFQVASAILYVESHFHPNIEVSSAGAVGAFQVLPTTGDQLGLPSLHNPAVNLKAGLKYILYIEEQVDKYCRFSDSEKESSRRYRDLIAASYNAGPGHLQKQDAQGQRCRLAAFPKFTREEYVSRFRKALKYRYIPGYLRHSSDQKLVRR